MKKILTILTLFICLFAKAQIPSGVPQYNYYPYYRDSAWRQFGQGIILNTRDTNFTPRFAGTIVFWQHAGVDTLLWQYDGHKWNKVGSGGGSSTTTLQQAYDNSVTAGTFPMITAAGTALTIQGDETAAITINARNSSSGNFYGISNNAATKQVKLTAGLNTFVVTDTNYHTHLSSGAGYVLTDLTGNGDLTMQAAPGGTVLDTSITWSVLDSLNTPPVSPTSGDVYEVGTVPTGAFVGHAGDIATWNGSAWTFQTPSTGDLLYNDATDLVSKWTGSVWLRVGKAAIHQGYDNFGLSPMRIGTSNARQVIISTNKTQRIGIAATGAITFNSAYTFPTSDGTANQALTTNGSGVLSFSTVHAPAPAALLGSYNASTNTSPPPNVGQIRYNNATQISSTNIYVNVETNNNVDISIFLALLKTNDVLIIQDENDATNYQYFTISSTPVNNTTYYTIPVTFNSSSGTGTTNFPNNHDVFLATYSTTTTGTVTSFSAGNLSPLFTTSVANATTTPALSFTLSNAAANTVLGNATGSSAAPSYGQIVNGQITNGTIDLTTKVTGVLPIANGGTNISTYTTGDILYASATNVLSKLPIGTASQTLHVVGGVPAWRDTTAAGGLSLAAIGSSPNANGATLSGSTLNLEPASSSFGGVVTTGTQQFAGAKEFTNSSFTLSGIPAFGVGTLTDSILTINPSTKAVRYSSINTVNYFTRYSGAASLVYLTNLNDSLAIGDNFRGAAKFYVNGTSRLAGNIAMGSSGLSTLNGVGAQYTINSASSSGLNMGLITSDVSNGSHAGVKGTISATGNSTSSAVDFYGGYFLAQNSNGSSNTTGLLGGVFAGVQPNGSGKMSYGYGVESQLIFGGSNSAINGDYYGFRSDNIQNISAGVDSIRYFHHFYADSISPNLVSTKIWGFYQKGSDQYNFFAGKTRIGYSVSGDSVSTTTLQIGGGLAVRATVSSAATLTLDNTSTQWVFSGTTSTWTLPAVASSVHWIYFIKNRGSGNLTINSNAGGNDIYDASAVSTITVSAGSAIILSNDGTYFDVE